MTLPQAIALMGREPDNANDSNVIWHRKGIRFCVLLWWDGDEGFIEISTGCSCGKEDVFPLTPATLHAARVLLEAAE